MDRLKVTTLFLILVGVALASASYIDYGPIKSFMDARAPDGNAEQFDRAFYGSLLFLLRVYALTLFVLAACLFLFRRRISTFSPRGTMRLLAMQFREFIEKTPGAQIITFLLIFALGTWLRLKGLDQPVRSDEAWTYLNYLSKDVFYVLTDYSSPNNHILHSLLSKTFLFFFGDTPSIFRLPALIAGLLSMPMGYWLFYRLGGRSAALITMALLACWPLLVDYATNARGYSMITLLTLSLFVAADAIRCAGRGYAYVAFGLVAALGLYTVPSFSLSILTAGIWLLLLVALGKLETPAVEFWQRLTVTAAASVTLTILLYAPVVAKSGVYSLLRNDVVTGNGIRAADLVNGLFNIAADWAQGVPVALITILIFGFAVLLWRRNIELVSIWVALFLTMLLVTILQGTMGPERVYMFALPMFLGCTAVGLASFIPRSWQKTSGLTLSLILSGMFLAFSLTDSELGRYDEFGKFDEANAITRYLTREMSEEDVWLSMFPANHPIAYYDRILNAKQSIYRQRAGIRKDTTARLRVFVVRPHGASLHDTLSWNDRIYGTHLLQHSYRVESELSIGTTAVSLLRLE